MVDPTINRSWERQHVNIAESYICCDSNIYDLICYENVIIISIYRVFFLILPAYPNDDVTKPYNCVTAYGIFAPGSLGIYNP